MIYVAGTLLSVVVVIVLLVGRPGVRKLVFVSVTIFGLVLWYFIDRSQREDAAIHALVATKGASNIELSDLRLEDVSLIPIAYGGYELDGAVTNNSRFTLSGMDFRVTLSDCLTPDACGIVGQRDTSISLTVPPGKKEAFKSEPLGFPNLPAPAQNRVSSFDLIAARAE